MEDESAKVFVSKLRERIQNQLSHEWNTSERVDDEMESLTVSRLLEMLEYMFEDD